MTRSRRGSREGQKGVRCQQSFLLAGTCLKSSNKISMTLCCFRSTKIVPNFLPRRKLKSSTPGTETGPVRTRTRLKVRRWPWICHFICSFCFFEPQRSEYETDHSDNEPLSIRHCSRTRWKPLVYRES